MFTIHTSMECYPAAKVGGLADVVGALPKYLHNEAQGDHCYVIIPKFGTKWFKNQSYVPVYSTIINHNGRNYGATVEQVESVDLGFPLFVVNIPGRFDRDGIYMDNVGGFHYSDEFERYLAFQEAVLNWINEFDKLPDIIHCHDHHTALIPFMMKASIKYERLKHIPSLLTIHNGEYHGKYHFSKARLIPEFRWNDVGLLDWNGELNALAAGVKTAWKVTTVSHTYMQELMYHSSGLEPLFVKEERKSTGVLNGIDTKIWDPSTDKFISHHYNENSVTEGKFKNKSYLCELLKLNPEKPIISFIGRMVNEKGADILPDLFAHFLEVSDDTQFVILGTGERWLHARFDELQYRFRDKCSVTLAYDEQLAHQIYAGSDFIIMPSRVEPCGLNQMYALRYGTIPIVRAVGGLRDTVTDLEDENGFGIRFYNFNLEESKEAINRALQLYSNKTMFDIIRQNIMKLDNSWLKAAENYKSIYKSFLWE